MSREIKFRAWCKRTNRKFTNEDLLAVGRAIIEKMKVLYKNKIDIENSKGGLFIPVDDENMIFEQYTGHKDKNGVEIYEGDKVIVNCDDDEIGVVVWDKDELEYGIDVENVHMKMGCFYSREIEVVGNIHEGAWVG